MKEKLFLNPEEEARQEATNLLALLGGKEGKKALILVVDDDSYKRQDVQTAINKAATERNTGYVLSLKEDGESAVRLYQAFRELDSQENPNKVVAMLDGTLGSDPSAGIRIAQQLVGLSRSKGWEVPYLVGISTSSHANKDLQEIYPSYYIAPFLFESNRPVAETLDAIDSKLNMNTEKNKPTPDNQIPDETRPVESLSLGEYIELLNSKISSATKFEEIYKLGIYDNTAIYIHSNNPRDHYEKILSDIHNPELFPDYRPLPPPNWYKPTEEEPRQSFRKNSQIVQIQLWKGEIHKGEKDRLRFITSLRSYPAGFSEEIVYGSQDEEERKRNSKAMGLASSKEQAVVVNHFLRYCQKNDLRGALHLYFKEAEKRAELSF